MRTLDRKSEKLNQAKSDPIMTKAKFADLKNKLERLKYSQPQAAAEVRRLAEMGDFSENYAYQIAKGRLRGINNAIMKLERELDQAVIIKPDPTTDVIQVGQTVTIQNKDGQKTFQILGSSETSPAQGIISYTSPIGAALIGHWVGETITIKIGKTDVEYVIIQVE